MRFNDERQGKYWICDACAQLRGWEPFKSAYTVIGGLCGWCESPHEERLTPLRDLKNKKGRRADCEEKKDDDLNIGAALIVADIIDAAFSSSETDTDDPWSGDGGSFTGGGASGEF